MTITIRPIRREDAEDWHRLRDALWEGDDHASEIAAFFRGDLEEPVEVLVACDPHGRIIGHVELSRRWDVPSLVGTRTGYIEGLYVMPEHRRRGLTRQLLRAAATWAQADGCAAFASDRDDRVIVHRRFGGMRR